MLALAATSDISAQRRDVVGYSLDSEYTSRDTLNVPGGHAGKQLLIMIAIPTVPSLVAAYDVRAIAPLLTKVG